MQRSFIRKPVVLAGLLGLLALCAVVPVASATRIPTNGLSCHPDGAGTICRSFEVETIGPQEDPNIVCGNGADAVHIFDQWVDNQTRTYWIDGNGNLTRYTDHDVYSFGQWSNPLTGDVVPYTERSVETIDWGVPGDDSTATDKFTGENIYRPATGGKFVLQAVGMQVFTLGGDLLASHGPNAFVDGLVLGDPHAFDQVCAALGAS